MTEMIHRPSASASLADKLRYAEALARASLLPGAYRQQPGNVLLAIEVGESLGLSTIVAINNINIIDGKPSMSAGLMQALVRKAGHQIRVWGNDAGAVAEIVRSDDRSFTYRAEWNAERAGRAKLLEKSGSWQTFRAAMYKSRAVSEVCRDACQEVLLGMAYTAEELGADVDEDGAVVVDAVDIDPTPDPTIDELAQGRIQELLVAAEGASTPEALRTVWKEAGDAYIDEPIVNPETGEVLRDEVTGQERTLRGIMLQLGAQLDSRGTVDADLPEEDAEVEDHGILVVDIPTEGTPE